MRKRSRRIAREDETVKSCWVSSSYETENEEAVSSMNFSQPCCVSGQPLYHLMHFALSMEWLLHAACFVLGETCARTVRFGLLARLRATKALGVSA